MSLLQDKRAAALKAANDAFATMSADPSEDSIKAADEATALVKSLDEQIKKAAEVDAQMKSLAQMAPAVVQQDGGVQARTIGEHFVKHAGKKLALLESQRLTIPTPEFKAAEDTQITGGPEGDLGVLLNEIDRTIIRAPRRQTITSLFGQGTMSGQAISYFVEAAIEGDFGMVEEAGKFPQMHAEDPTLVMDAASKIAGFIKLSYEMMHDLDFLVSEINNRLMYMLSLVEEYQVLFGDGTDANLVGLLERSGVQTGTTDKDGLADEIFKSMTAVAEQSGLTADALVINPADYEALRLQKDGNEQYLGGGFFQGQYGQGGIALNPPVWGLRTVVTPAVSQGTAVVGAFRTGATVYHKGGVRVEATNSNEDDFIHDLVTVRAAKRMALAVRRPAAFLNLTIS